MPFFRPRHFFRPRPPRVPMRPFDEARLPPTEPISPDRALEEGLLLADFAVRMTVRNSIITDMLSATDAAFTPALFVGVARDALLALSDEAGAAEARLAAEHRLATVLEGEPEHSHDYRPVDAGNLSRRQSLAHSTAEALRRQASDERFLLDVVERARAEAWGEISREIELRIDRAWADPDPAGRSERLAGLRAELRRLVDGDD
ncbi:hypothetical protein [Leifsonia sp. 2MCAF36]|uniref:hypothetical protein n=1 Tax=Leifsonia sp. 2MCAF36 TaxID=3232988 RepID=UPI003F954E74